LAQSLGNERMERSEKILLFDETASLVSRLKAEGRKIVQCHGTFDIIHPGHVLHLQAAKALGDLLLVTLTSDPHVHQGPGRPFFSDGLRARSLAALECVDYVIPVPHPGAVEAIRQVRPDFFCRGKEDENPALERAEELQHEIAAVAEVGGVICYVGPDISRTGRLLNNYFDNLAEPIKVFCRDVASRFSGPRVAQMVEDFAKLRVLVIGDTIFDRYSYLKVQGLTSKNRIISGRFLGEETQCGGALAVFRHIKQFTGQAQFLSLVGTEPWVEGAVREAVLPEEDLVVRDPRFTTVVKQRYVEPLSTGKELSKLFSVNYLDAQAPSRPTIEAVLGRLELQLPRFDLVVAADFGHGLMQDEIRALVQDKAKFLALNCQTNSNNHGFNIISRQYRKARAFSLDEQELLLACGRRQIDYRTELEKLRELLQADYAWLTRGAVETIGIEGHAPIAVCPPFEDKITDTVGAGDAFFSVTALAAASALPVEVATFLGQLAGAQVVRIVGNAQPISKPTLLKSCTSMLSF
jgi:cytidyltransferase-like protein